MPPVPPPAELALLRARVMELEAENARLREAAAGRDELAAAQLAAAQAQLAARDAQLQALAARVEELERRLGKDSGTSSKPPSSDSPYQKKTRDRSLRGRSGRRPGKQPGAQASTLKQSADPGQRAECAPAACGCCGADLGGAAVIGMQKRQVFEASPPPPPTVIEYQVQAKACARCGAVTEGVAPAHATGRAQYGPLVHAKAALAVCAHHLPVARAARLVSALTGVTVSTGFMAGIRAKAAARLGPFMDRVRELLRSAGVLYADETPARARGHLRDVHVACTEFLTAMHTGGRSADDIDAGNVLPGYAGTIVRDGYAGYQHLADALHAWCGAPPWSRLALVRIEGSLVQITSPLARRRRPGGPPGVMPRHGDRRPALNWVLTPANLCCVLVSYVGRFPALDPHSTYSASRPQRGQPRD